MVIKSKPIPFWMSCNIWSWYRGAAEGSSCEHHRGGHEEASPGRAGQRVLRQRLRVREGVQGAAGFLGHRAGEGLWRGLGLGLWRGLGHGPLGLAAAAFCLALAALVVAVLAELFARRPADGRAHRGDVAQQEVEVVAAPVVKDHWDGLGRLGRDVAGVAQRPEILPGAVAVVELLLGGLEGREALPAVSGGPVLQLLPPGHADGPSSASPGKVVVGQLEKVVQHGADCVVLVAVPLVVREPQPQLLGRHVAAAADRDVAGRGRDGLARWLLLRYVDRGLEFACFCGQKTESRARRMSGARFWPKTSEFGGPGTTFNV